MQVHPLARLLVPDRRVVRRANQLPWWQLAEIPVELDRLVRVERVHASPAPLREGVGQDGRDAVAQVQRGDLQPVDEAELEQGTLEERRSPFLRQAVLDRVGGQPIVERALEDELDERLEIEAVGGHAKHDTGRRLRRVADRAGVAHGAVQPHLVEAEAAASGDANREVLAWLGDESEGRVPVRELVAADRWQRPEHPVRRQDAADRREQASTRLAPDRPVLEVLLDRLVGHRSIGRDRNDGPDADEHAQYHDGEAKERERAPNHRERPGIAGSPAIQTRALESYQVDSSGFCTALIEQKLPGPRCGGFRPHRGTRPTYGGTWGGSRRA